MIHPRLCLAFKILPFLPLFPLLASSAIAESDSSRNWQPPLLIPQLLADTPLRNSPSHGKASTPASRAAYREVSLPQDKNLVGTDPKQIARSVFGNLDPGEGNFQEEVLLVEQTDKGALVTLTQTGLADDSVAGMRYRLEFIRQGNRWQLDWAGRQVRCYPGRGSQAWTIESCQ